MRAPAGEGAPARYIVRSFVKPECGKTDKQYNKLILRAEN